MVKIAFCDDDPALLQELSLLLNQYRIEHKDDLHATSFHSSLDLISEIERGARFDILFLDIIMPGVNGIDTASEIRSYDSNVKIIFLTSSADFAVQSYTVSAYFYQLKPIQTDRFFRLMDSVLALCEKEQTSSLILRCKTGITRVDPKQIEYCEVIHRTLFIHLTSGTVLECIGSMEDLSHHLMPYGNFLRPHRSYLVNLDYVQTLHSNAITMSSLTQIPIPRGKYNETKNAFLAYTFDHKQAII